MRGVERLDAFVEDIVIARLSQPDAAEVRSERPADTAPLHEEAAALPARLDEAATGWAAGVLTQSQLIKATQELRGRLRDVENRIGQARQGDALDGLLGGQDLREAWHGLPLDRRRAVLESLLVVTVLPRQTSWAARGWGLLRLRGH